MGHGVTAIERTIPAQPKDSTVLKAAGPSPREGDGDGTVGEVDGHGTYEEDDPATWETLAFPRDSSGTRSPATETPRVFGVLRVHTKTCEERDTFHEVGRRQGEPEPRPTGSL